MFGQARRNGYRCWTGKVPLIIEKGLIDIALQGIAFSH
jgi:hypothetical protein